MRFQSITYGIMPSIIGQKGKEEGALAAYTQQIHLRVKGTICTSFSITSQVQQVLKTSRYPGRCAAQYIQGNSYSIWLT